jgi:hypothetical protein
MKTVIPDIILERYLLKELPARKMEEIDRLVSEDPTLRQRLDALKSSSEEILREYTPEYVGGLIKQKVPAKKMSRSEKIRRISIPALGSAAAMVLLFFILPSEVHKTEHVAVMNNPVKNNPQNDIIFKGEESRLFIFRKTDGSPDELKTGSAAHEGDQLQLGFQTRMTHAVIVSIDGRGNVTLHYPASGSGSSIVGKDRKTLLDRSYRLDDAPSFERFLLVTSDVGITAGYIVSRARGIAADRSKAMAEPLSVSGTKEVSLLLIKE